MTVENFETILKRDNLKTREFWNEMTMMIDTQ